MRVSFRPQFSLRLMLFVVTALAIWLGTFVARVREQRSVVAALQNLGVKLRYDFETDAYGYDLPKSGSPVGPAWLRRSLGDDFFARVTAVHGGQRPATDDELRGLFNLPRLRYADLHGTAVSDDFIRRLQRTFSNLTVRHRNTAYLGTRLKPATERGCLISGVAKNSPAEKAGLKIGDLVLAVDGAAIANDDEFIFRVARYWPGEAVELTIRRDDNVLQKKAILQPVQDLR